MNLRNLRQPALNLDSIYGDGPAFYGETPTEAADFYNGVKLKVGKATGKENNPGIPGALIPPVDDLLRDYLA